jgi:acetolactate synthase small subunit
MGELQWVLVVKVLNKSGAVTAVASVFSNRGVSLEAIVGSGIAATTEEDGRLILRFHATERKKTMLQRALERLSKVVQVEAYGYDDPRLRSVAVVKASSLAGVDLNADAIQTETIAQTDEEQTVLLTGATIAVEQVIETLRQRSQLVDVVMAAIAV